MGGSAMPVGPQSDRTEKGRVMIAGRRRVRVSGAPCAVVAVGLLVLASCSTGPSQEQRARQLAARDAADQAQAHLELGRPELALAEFERAIELNPDFTEAYLGAGEQLERLGDYEQAEARYRAAAELQPDNPTAHFRHGRVLQVLGRVGEAIRAYLAALSIDPRDAEANVNLSVAYMQAEEPALARPFAERAVLIQPRNGAARINLGSIYAALGEHRLAVDEYQQAAELVNPIPRELLINLAESLRQLGRDAEVVNVLDQLLASDPTAAAWERRGSALFRLREYDRALESFQNALSIDPGHYPAHNGIGVYRLNQYIWSDQADLEARQEGIRHLKRSLQIEYRQPRIRELVSRFG